MFEFQSVFVTLILYLQARWALGSPPLRNSWRIPFYGIPQPIPEGLEVFFSYPARARSSSYLESSGCVGRSSLRERSVSQGSGEGEERRVGYLKSQRGAAPMTEGFQKPVSCGALQSTGAI